IVLRRAITRNSDWRTVMNDNEEFEVKKAAEALTRLRELHGEEYGVRRASMKKWLVFCRHWEDYTFIPLAIVDARDEKEALLKALTTEEGVAAGMVLIQARRLTHDEGRYGGKQNIVCADCGQRVESSNDAMCSQCLERFLVDIDNLRMIPK